MEGVTEVLLIYGSDDTAAEAFLCGSQKDALSGNSVVAVDGLC